MFTNKREDGYMKFVPVFEENIKGEVKFSPFLSISRKERLSLYKYMVITNLKVGAQRLTFPFMNQRILSVNDSSWTYVSHHPTSFYLSSQS